MEQSLCVEMLDTCVSEPSVSQITEDLLQVLKQFKNYVHWKEFWWLKCKRELLAKGKKLIDEDGKDLLDEDVDDENSTDLDDTNFKGLVESSKYIKWVENQSASTAKE
eukprot:695943-Ditylum_brightwellii.AAC.1